MLNNTADVFDWADTIPGSLLPQIQSQAADRYKKVSELDVLLLPEHQGQAVLEPAGAGGGRDRPQPGRADRARLGHPDPGCYFLPPGMVGHPTGPCPYGNPASGGNIAKAKQLVQQSGMAGQPVTVWGESARRVSSG